jgi:TPP-dependent pyruvate/acetoin dehydrogenase alpha subunit
MKPTQLLTCYDTMRLIRTFEESILRLHGEGKLPGFMHVSIGQEAIPTGVSLHLRDDDVITTTHRGHGDVIAKGAPVEGMFAELFARAEGLCRGKGGSMHVTDVSRGILGANGIVAAGIPIAAGAAFAAKRSGSDAVAVSYFGDGAIAQGGFHESANMAALWKLPIVLVRQNNQYAESTPNRDYQGMPDVVQFVRGYGIAAEQVDGNDVDAVSDAAERAVARARAGDGPTFLECLTYRWYGHNIGDTGAGRPEDEVQSWIARDPIATVRKQLEHEGLGDALAEIDARVSARIERAIERAESLAEPPLEWALEDLFTDFSSSTLIGGSDQ